MHYLTAAAIFQNESHWLDEWIHYHIEVGVERFLMYCDEEDARVSTRLLRKFVDRGIVELFHVKNLPGISASEWHQFDAYRDAISRAAGKTRWLMLVDIDEFMLPKKSDDLRESLADYEEFESVAVHWAIFGSSGCIRRPENQINRLLRRAPLQDRLNVEYKSIVRPDSVDLTRIDSSHRFLMRDDISPERAIVNEQRIPVREKHADPNISHEILQLNHYICRSYQDWVEVRSKRGIPLWRRNYEFYKQVDRNDVFDDEISKRFGHVVGKIDSNDIPTAPGEYK